MAWTRGAAAPPGRQVMKAMDSRTRWPSAMSPSTRAWPAARARRRVDPAEAEAPERLLVDGQRRRGRTGSGVGRRHGAPVARRPPSPPVRAPRSPRIAPWSRPGVPPACRRRTASSARSGRGRPARPPRCGHRVARGPGGHPARGPIRRGRGWPGSRGTGTSPTGLHPTTSNRSGGIVRSSWIRRPVTEMNSASTSLPGIRRRASTHGSFSSAKPLRTWSGKYGERRGRGSPRSIRSTPIRWEIWSRTVQPGQSVAELPLVRADPVAGRRHRRPHLDEVVDGGLAVGGGCGHVVPLPSLLPSAVAPACPLGRRPAGCRAGRAAPGPAR